MWFTPKLKGSDAPAITNKYYVPRKVGGLSDCLRITTNSVLPNCVGYALGRFMEVQQLTKTKHPYQANGGQIYRHTEDGYQRGQIPQAGALICWDNPGYAGHVGFVEQVNSDGSIVVSQSGYRKGKLYDPNNNKGPSGDFWVDVIPKSSKGYVPKWTTRYVFQGFVYNPGADANLSPVATTATADSYTTVARNSSTLLHTATLNLGLSGIDFQFITGGADKVWGTRFVSWCLINSSEVPQQYKIDTSSLTDLVTKLRAAGATLLIKPTSELYLTPKLGDLILLRNNNVVNYTNENSSEQIGIVSGIYTNGVSYIIGDVQNKVQTLNLPMNSRSIYGYVKLTSEESSLAITSPFTFSRKDAIIRETGYCTTVGYLPTLLSLPGNYKWSVINYNTAQIFNDMLPKLQSLIAAYGNNQSTNDSAINSSVSYLRSKSISFSGSVAIVSICIAISNLNPGFENDGRYGLLGWTNYVPLQNRMGINWQSNRSGQFDYILDNIRFNNSSLYNRLRQGKNTIAEAKQLSEELLKFWKLIPKSDVNKIINSVWNQNQQLIGGKQQ